MRYSREHSEQTLAKIMDAAAREFRALGYHGVGIDGLAKAAGVTSGAFYKHFASKSDGFRAVVAGGLEQLRAAIEHYKASQQEDWLAPFLDFYLGPEHRGNLAGGCTLAGLTSEAVRADPEVRTAFQEELLKVAEAIADGLPRSAGRAAAWPILAQLLGGVLLARVVTDEDIAQEIADTVKASIKPGG
jgi:AcrR family transcriptional regulator